MSHTTRVTINRDPQRLILTFRMTAPDLTLEHEIYEAAVIAPPHVNFGGTITTFVLCTADGRPAEVPIHTNLICAASEWVKQLLNKTSGQATGKIDLSEIRSETFSVLSHWLYRGQIPVRQPSKFAADEFWALVFGMARYLGVPMLQLIAFEKFQACFSINEISITTRSKIRNPSTQLLRRFFGSIDPDSIIQAWIIDHLHWANRCMPSVFVEAAYLFDSSSRLRKAYIAKLIAGELCVRISL